MGTKNCVAPQAQGVPIILTGSATDMSDFKLSPFRAFTGGFPTAIIPRFLLRKYWYPRVRTNQDTTATLELVDKLKRNKLFYVPLLFTSEDECMLKESRHMDLKHLTPVQWELLATCWGSNIEIFADGTQWSAKFGAMLAYVLYYRWKHGKKALQPLMKLAVMPKNSAIQRSAF
ncbi:MAG: hypothetical protein CW716_00800 [Candidatus Bathyarchaeum sp.]|nr:MAG: hypothetical protein CW716_00800 [Candidatus Bathyarchaeum sp.]